MCVIKRHFLPLLVGLLAFTAAPVGVTTPSGFNEAFSQTCLRPLTQHLQGPKVWVGLIQGWFCVAADVLRWRPVWRVVPQLQRQSEAGMLRQNSLQQWIRRSWHGKWWRKVDRKGLGASLPVCGVCPRQA